DLFVIHGTAYRTHEQEDATRESLLLQYEREISALQVQVREQSEFIEDQNKTINNLLGAMGDMRFWSRHLAFCILAEAKEEYALFRNGALRYTEKIEVIGTRVIDTYLGKQKGEKQNG